MLFNSIAFAIFLPIVFLLYWILPHKFRWLLLLTASYYFYMSWNVKYVGLILFTTVVSYLSALLMEKADLQNKKKILMAATLVASLGVLFFFKYFDFLAGSFCNVLSRFAIPLEPVTLNLIVPVGISFYTFQTLSYVIDVYRGDIKAEQHFGKYAAFISFFPQLVAGPIERAKNLLPQIKEEHQFDYTQASYGLKLMAWGFFKKLVIADNLGPHVDTVYAQLQNYSGFSLVLVSIFFAIQIYCDFSGYSDIAIGTAKLFGIDLMKNFKSPYFSASIKEFWSRWHISLSTWFKDYVYIPMGGNRVGKLRHSFNLLVTFLVSGLWHGAAWTYVVWGGAHGTLQVLENMLFPNAYTKKKKEEGSRHNIIWWIRVFLVFMICTAVWVLFRAKSMAEVQYVFSHFGDGFSDKALYFQTGLLQLGITEREIILLGIALCLLTIYDYLSLRRDVIAVLSIQKVPVRWFIYTALLLFVFLFSPVNASDEFIYFQF